MPSSRREFTRGVSAGLLCSAGVSHAFASPAQGSNAVSLTPKKESAVPYSLDFDAYTRTHLDALIKLAANKKHTSEDVLAAVRALRPATSHLKKSTLEVSFQEHIASLKSSDLATVAPTKEFATAYLQGVDPSIRSSEVARPSTLSEAELTASLARLKANGLAGTLQSIADVMEMQAMMPGLANAQYTYNEHLGHAHLTGPHLERVCFFCSKKQFCASFAAAIADTSLLALIIGIICGVSVIATAGSTAAFCALVWGTGVPAGAVIAAAMVLYQAICQDNGLGLVPSSS